MNDKRRFLAFNLANLYFKGDLMMGSCILSRDDKLDVIDLQDFTIQKVFVRDLLTDEIIDMFYSDIRPRGNKAQFTISDLTVYFGAYEKARFEHCIRVNEKMCRVFTDGRTVSIDHQVCGLHREGNTLMAKQHDESFILFRVPVFNDAARLLAMYRVRNSLILCYQILSASMQVSIAVNSVSLSYSLETGDFQGYYIYGRKATIFDENSEFYLKRLSKEILRG